MIIYNDIGDNIYEYNGTLKETLEKIAKESPDNPIPLRYMNLNGMDISNSNLENMVFIGTDLRGTNLSGCNLNNATFRDCHMDENTNFVGATIRGEVLKQNPIYYNTGTPWDVMILDEKIIMGCQCHHLKTWENATDEALRKIEKDCVQEFRIRCDKTFADARVHQKEYLDSIGYK